MVVDNLLWKGEIAEPAEAETPEAKAIAAFNVYLMSHPQLRAVILPLGAENILETFNPMRIA